MDTSTTYELSAFELRERIFSGELSAEKVTDEIFRRIEDRDPQINAYLTLDKERALETAKGVDGRIKRGEKCGLLAGVPVAVKDNICTRGLRTTCASKLLGNFVPIENNL